MSLASNAALLTLTTPISTTIFAFLFLGERMTRIRWFGFALAIAGVLLCSNISFHSLNLGGGYLAGNALILMGTLGSAFYNSYSKKALKRYTPLETLFYSYAGMFLLMTPLVVVEQRRLLVHFSSFTATTWIGFALLTIFHYFLSMVLFLKALTKLDATQAALSNYLVAFFGLPIAAFMLKERLNTSAIIGGVVVLGSTLLITLWKQKPREAGLAASAVGDPARN